MKTPAIVDQPARRKLAQGIRWLANGRIMSDEFEDIYGPAALDSPDPVVGEMLYAAWGLYDDFTTQRLVGPLRLRRETRQAIGRWILFLHSARPYEWPFFSRRWAVLAWLPVHLATLGLTAKLRFRRWQRHGEFSVWPYLRAKDYRAALRSPVFLHLGSIGTRPK